MSDTLSATAQKKLIALKKAARTYLVAFKQLKGTPAFGENKHKYEAVRDLFTELNLMDLNAVATAPAAAEPAAPNKAKSSKEERKARRAARKAARKERKNSSKRADRRAARKAKKAAPTAAVQQTATPVIAKSFANDKDGVKSQADAQFQELNGLSGFITSLGSITDGFKEALEKAKTFVTKAENYIAFAEGFAPPGTFDAEIAKAKEWVGYANKFIAIADNIVNQAARYNKIFLDIQEVIGSLPSSVDELKDNVVTTATQVFAAAKQFLATADGEAGGFDLGKLQAALVTGQDKLDKLSDLVGVIIQDEDKNNLPDWFDKLQAQYEQLLGGTTDLIPGTDLDDKVLLQIKKLNGQLVDFIAAASDKVEALDIQGKIEQAKKWLSETGAFLTAITGFVENIKEGDLLGIYNDLKSFKEYLNSNPDIYSQTQLDNQLLDMLAKNSKKAEDWLMNKLSGGDADKKTEIKLLLGVIDSLILSSGNKVNHTPKYEKDESAFNLPDVVALSKGQQNLILAENGINPDQKGIPYDRVLAAVVIETLRKKGVVTAKYQEFLTVGVAASEELKDARDQFDGAVEGHNNYLRAINTLGIKAIGALVGVAANLLAPGLGSVVKALGGAFLGDMSLINGEIDKLIPGNIPLLGEISKGLAAEVFPQFASERGIIDIHGDKVLAGLTNLYASGITDKYATVTAVLINIEANAEILQKNLIALGQQQTVSEAQIDEINQKILLLSHKWKLIVSEIQKKYLDAKRPVMNTRAAFFNASRYFHSIWIVRFPKKEIRIGDTMIKEFTTFGIIAESGAEWKSGFWAKAGRGFFGFFGADPFDYREELEKMKVWGVKELGILQTPDAWKRSF